LNALPALDSVFDDSAMALFAEWLRLCRFGMECTEMTKTFFNSVHWGKPTRLGGGYRKAEKVLLYAAGGRKTGGKVML